MLTKRVLERKSVGRCFPGGLGCSNDRQARLDEESGYDWFVATSYKPLPVLQGRCIPLSLPSRSKVSS
jgi:hypothetical protein